MHKNKYDYSLINYKNTEIPIKIICKHHGIFEQTPTTHLAGYGCSKCSGCYKYSTKEFIQLAKQVHKDDDYDYSKLEYMNKRTKIKIICKKHGEFEKLPNNFIYGKKGGCPKCRESKGEGQVREILENMNIIYISQYRFGDCKNKRALPFDFFLPKTNTCIEYDGIHHFIDVDYWGNNFDEIKKHDEIKNEYCKDNNIHLIRIRYDEDINMKLKKYLS